MNSLSHSNMLKSYFNFMGQIFTMTPTHRITFTKVNNNNYCFNICYHLPQNPFIYFLTRPRNYNKPVRILWGGLEDVIIIVVLLVVFSTYCTIAISKVIFSHGCVYYFPVNEFLYANLLC